MKKLPTQKDLRKKPKQTFSKAKTIRMGEHQIEDESLNYIENEHFLLESTIATEQLKPQDKTQTLPNQPLLGFKKKKRIESEIITNQKRLQYLNKPPQYLNKDIFSTQLNYIASKNLKKNKEPHMLDWILRSHR